MDPITQDIDSELIALNSTVTAPIDPVMKEMESIRATLESVSLTKGGLVEHPSVGSWSAMSPHSRGRGSSLRDRTVSKLLSPIPVLLPQFTAARAEREIEEESKNESKRRRTGNDRNTTQGEQ